MAEVFINYRTGDGDEAAELLASRLSDRFGKEHVFKASHSIQPGESFPKELIHAAQKSNVLLAVMGPDWGAAPQLRQETDWVRTEILAAQTSGTRVVPVVKGRKTDRLARGTLPPELMWLADVHSLRLDMHESTDDLARIGDFLADLLPTLKASDRAADEPAASGATDNSASDVAGNIVQGRDISGGVHNFNFRDSNGPAMLGDGNTQHNLGSPPQEEVYRRFLRVEGLANGTDLPASEFLKKTRHVGEIRQFVNNILAARNQRADTDDKGDLKDWIEAAEKPTSPREAPVSESLTRLLSAPQRALLLSVAMLHGAHADVIDHAASALVASLTGEADAALEQLPLGQRLHEIGARTDAIRHVHFARAEYEVAVRLFFWRHFPELHDDLATWVRITLESNDLSDDDREEMARGFAIQCLDARYQHHWTNLIGHLTAQKSDPARELAAAAIIQVGLEDEVNSRTFRRQIYVWSRESGTSGSLATVLVFACQQMTRTHPAEALVRLHHLARSHPERTDIWDVLADVVYGHGPLLRLLLSRLADRPFETTRTVDARIFLHVADPARLTARQSASQPPIAQSDVTPQLAAGWTLAFTRLPGTEWASRASDWLRRAAEDDTNRHLLLNVLIEGGRPATAVLPQLYGLAHRAPFRDVIADLVLNQISAVQGVEFP